jgi:RimJ/RimL family protein N-acetyltransferase
MIQGKNIYLKPFEKEDIEFVLSLVNDQELAYWEGKNEFPKTMAEQENWFMNNNDSKQRFIVCEKETNIKYGYVSFYFKDVISRAAHTAIKLSQDSRGKGIGTDSVKTIMSFAFNKMNVHRLFGHIIEFNIGSMKLFTKCGWSVEGKERESIFMNGKHHDNILVSILSHEYYDYEEEYYLNLFKFS